MNKITFSVPNINCNHCVNTIETELGDVEGVTNVAASSDSKQVEVEYKDPANEEALLALLGDINYPAVV